MLNVFIFLILTFRYSNSYFHVYSRDNDSDCLYYFKIRHIADVHLVPYCIQQSASLSLNGHKFTFRQLRESDISSAQLYEWLAPIDIIESYQIYLNSDNVNSIKNSEIFYNCSNLWFGSFCQYRLNSSITSFTNIVEERFTQKENYNIKDVIEVTNGTCYTNFICDYILLPPACLDWREICDGKLDCMSGEDEEQCSLLETNICKDGYFRCRNGFCIPESLLYDLTGSIDCVDDSDVLQDGISRVNCYIGLNIFSCDESICQDPMMFACGDGMCIKTSLFQKDDDCINGRHLIHSRSMLQNQNGYLSDECWKAIICLFELQYIFDIDCSELFASNYSNIVIKETCPSQFLFPPNPILFNSIYLIYNTTNKSEWINNVTPTYICYDIQQCRSMLKNSTIRINDKMCLKYEEFGLKKKYEKWNDLLIDMTNLFKACSLPGLEIVTNNSMIINYNDNHECPHPSLLHCKGSSKCISKYRIIDGYDDCFNSYDEYYNRSCSLDLKHRYQCENESKCVPFVLQYSKCDNRPYPNMDYLCDVSTWMFVCIYFLRPIYGLPFGKLCNKWVELEPDSYNETDETNCQHDWPCFTRYTKCDYYWHCKNGIDEVNCFEINHECNINQHYCQHPITGNTGCIHIDDINTNQMQCLGATDQRDFCREKYPNEIERRYRCLNSSECISALYLCDCEEDCPLGDDEYMVCPWLRNFTCDPNGYRCKNGKLYPVNSRCNNEVDCKNSAEDEMYCDLIDTYKRLSYRARFDLDGFPTYPPSVSSISASDDDDLIDSDILDDLDYSSKVNHMESAFLYWHCNRGILIYSIKTFGCLCPPAYYGDRCQYQSERISIMMLIHKQTAFERHVVFKLILFLLDNEINIISTEQIIYIQSEACEPKYNIYLSYDRRPRIYTNYSVRIDAYSQSVFNNLIDYRASWYYPIPFSFLPVFKLVIDPMIPESSPENTDASRICEHGRWLPYINSNEYFCLCDTGWSGKLCNISYECQCSKNSLCIGHTALTKKSICVCELGKFGTLCFIPNTACQSNTCLNNGKCVNLDQRGTNTYHCVCTQEYYGDRCQYNSFRIILNFIDVIVPPSILIHLITVNLFVPIKYEVIFQKIQLYTQNDVTVYIKNHFEVNIGYAEINENYYLIFLLSQRYIDLESISSYISLANRCPHVRELFNQTVLGFHLLKRAKFYHRPCLEQHQLLCFYDEIHMCLCNENRQTDCYGFQHNRTYDCNGNNYCQNNALCFHDELRCPTYSKCVCRECFYGVRCQFTTSIYSLTLDSIIGPYISPGITFHRQSLIIKLLFTVTIIIFIIGLTDNILSMMIFSQKTIFSTGCGVYLLLSSITSLLTIIIFTYKFIYFLCTQSSLTNNSTFLCSNCIITDFCLKLLPSMNSWFNACVAIDRAVCIILEVKFNKKKSRRIAIIISLLVVILNIAIAIPDLFSRELINSDERIWCVAIYHRKPWLNLYNKVIIIINLTLPFVINFISAIVIIIKTAHVKSRATIQQRTYREHLRSQFQMFKHLIISPFILIILALPRSILPFVSGCMKSEREASVFIALYFLSFLPSMTTFTVFVLPSQTYLTEFYSMLKRHRTNIKHLLHIQN